MPAGPNPDSEGDKEESDAELMPIPALPEVSRHTLQRFLVVIWYSKYRDPLHILLEYIAEVSSLDLSAPRVISKNDPYRRPPLTAIWSSFMMMTWHGSMGFVTLLLVKALLPYTVVLRFS
jgi:hypothetical protein